MTERFPGSRVRVTFTVTDAAGVPTDPDDLRIIFGHRRAKTPDEKSYPADTEVVQDDTGIFHIDIDCDTQGLWAARAEATGAVVAATEVSWQVAESNFTLT